MPTNTWTVITVVLALAAGCGNDNGPVENTGSACTAGGDCFKSAKAPLKGDVVCLTKVTGGYCTHTCQTDADCCAVEGECRSGIKQVCSPFENMPQKYCFLSCEPDVVTPSGKDEATYCHENAHVSFSCRSSGGGAMNRKVCVP
jgi:hypothetical protein